MRRALTPCEACGRHVRPAEIRCPFCGAERASSATHDEPATALRGGAILLGAALAMGACQHEAPSQPTMVPSGAPGSASSGDPATPATGQPPIAPSTPVVVPTPPPPISAPSVPPRPVVVRYGLAPRPQMRYGLARPPSGPISPSGPSDPSDPSSGL